MSLPQTENLLTMAQAAKIVGVSTQTISRRIKCGELPAYNIGPRAVRISPSDLQQLATPTAAQQREQHIQRLLEAAPRLSPEQRDRLAVLVRPAGSNGISAALHPRPAAGGDATR